VGQRPVGVDVQASSEALPAIYSMKSEQSIVKNTIAFAPENMEESQSPQKVVHCPKESMFTRFCIRWDGQTEPRTSRCPARPTQTGR